MLLTTARLAAARFPVVLMAFPVLGAVSQRDPRPGRAVRARHHVPVGPGQRLHPESKTGEATSMSASMSRSSHRLRSAREGQTTGAAHDTRRCPRNMAILRMDNVLIVVDDLEAAKAFFAELGMELEGEATNEGPWADQ